MASKKEMNRRKDIALNKVLDIIIKAEKTDRGGRNPYDTIIGFNLVKFDKPLTKMTLAEVRQNGRRIVNETKGKIPSKPGLGSSAVGAFQMLSNEFKKDPKDGVRKVIPYSSVVGDYQKKLGLSDDTLFTAEVQRAMAKRKILDLAKNELNTYLENPTIRNAKSFLKRIGRKGNVAKGTTDGWEGLIHENTNNQKMLGYGEVDVVFKESNLSTEKTTDDQMSDLGLSTNQSETQSNPNEDRLDDNVTRAMDKFRDILKDKETIKTLKQIQNARDLLDVVGTGPTSGVVNKLLKSKDIEKEVNKLNDNDSFNIYNYLREAVNEIIGVKPAGASEKFNMDGIKTLQEKFKDMAVSMGPVIDTSDTAKQRKESFFDPVISEEARSPDMIGDTSSMDAPLVSYGGDKVGTAPELQVSDMDNLEETQILFDPEKRREVRTSIQSGDSRTDRPNKITGEPQERRSMPLARPPEETAEFPESDDFSPNYSIIDSIPMEDFDELGSGVVDSIPMEDANEIGSGKKLNPEKDMEPRERSEQDLDYFVDEAQPMGGEFEGDDIDAGSGPVDFSFIKSLFSGGFDGRNSESELNMGADYFYDEVNPVGGEADPNDDVLRFDEGGTADFDGKKEEDDDEGDPPPLAKPEEVADDIPAMLSEGEYVLPANVVRYLGLERIMDMHRQVLSEIKQMEDLGMIQNVDKNGEPEEDDKEMKFLEPEEGEEAVSKGTLIIASSKPKGMMCPEPLKFAPGGSTSGDDGSGGGVGNPSGGPNSPSEATGQDKDKDKDNDKANEKSETQTNPNERTSREVGTTTNPNEDRAKDPTAGLDPDAPGFGFAKSVRGIMQGVQKGITDITGYNPPPSASRDREKSEKEASQPGDSEMELDGKIDDKDIKVSKVDDVIADLKNKNVYIPGVGYFPLQGLMSSEDTTIV
tara:strand:- start:1118 stop:3883 length:2766 start_codon:yes stop_codon:yes gene_type:complete